MSFHYNYQDLIVTKRWSMFPLRIKITLKVTTVFIILYVIAGAGCVSTKVQPEPMAFEARPDDFAAKRVWPRSGSVLLDDKKMSPDFGITYQYQGGSFLGSKNYVIVLKAIRNSQISSGEKTASFTVDKEKLEKIFLMLVQQKFFDVEPMMVVRLRQQLPSLFGVGGAQVTFRAQADRTIGELPPLPFKVRESNIDYARILRIDGLPADVTKEKLEQAVAEAKGLTEVFEAILAPTPESAFKEVGL